MEDNTKNFLDDNWEKQCLLFHICQFDKNLEYGSRRLSYDLGTNFDHELIHLLKAFADEVNNRFPNIKLHLSGTGWQLKDQEEITE